MWNAFEALRDHRRRTTYELLRKTGRAMSRDEVAGALGVPRHRAVSDLERLAEDGLLTISFARRGERTGPGAGRPTKFYAATAADLALSYPHRSYELLAGILAGAIAQGGDDETGDTAGDTADRAARAAQAAGVRTAHERRERADGARCDPADVLADAGYEPYRDPAGEVRLRNCPFHRVQAEHAEVVCMLNQRFVRGVLDGCGAAEELTAVGDGHPEECCVVVRARPGRGQGTGPDDTGARPAGTNDTGNRPARSDERGTPR